MGTALRVRELPTAGTALPRGQRPRPQAHAYGRPFGFQVVDHRTSLLATTSIAFQNRSQKTLYLILKKRRTASQRENRVFELSNVRFELSGLERLALTFGP
jgi:hypothetical protein